jgi:hypothetical protein
MQRQSFRDAEQNALSPVQTLTTPNAQDVAAKAMPEPQPESSPIGPISSTPLVVKIQRHKSQEEASAVQTNDTATSPLGGSVLLSPKGSVSSPASPSNSGELDEFTRVSSFACMVLKFLVDLHVIASHSIKH